MRKILYKKVFSLTLLVCVCFNLFGCIKIGPRKYEKDGVTYVGTKQGWYISHIEDSQLDESQKSIYIPDEINGESVISIGVGSLVGSYLSIRVYVDHTEKIYFPWSILVSESDSSDWNFEEDNSMKYVISASAQVLVDKKSIHNHKYVVPLVTYIDATKINSNGYSQLSDDEKKMYLPANIAYFFNYPGNPNEGYFFVDIVETTGNLVQPPYEPKREGYTFDGWYKEPECVEKWNFETDIVTVNYDEEGNRIYEEFSLYAKWIKN